MSKSIGAIQSPTELDVQIPGMEGDNIQSRGGFDYPDAEKETANSMSGLPPLPDTFKTPDANPGFGGSVPWPAIDAKSRTIPLDIDKK